MFIRRCRCQACKDGYATGHDQVIYEPGEEYRMKREREENERRFAQAYPYIVASQYVDKT